VNGRDHDVHVRGYHRGYDCPHSHGDGKSKWHNKDKAENVDEFGNQWVEAQAPKRQRSTEETISLWWTAIGSTLLISAAPFFILFLVPLDGSDEYKPFLNVLLSFAAGGLLGDAFLHLIPHAIPADSGDHGHSHDHGHAHDGGHGHTHNTAQIVCNQWVLIGMLTFLFIEKWARVLDIGHTHSHGDETEQVVESDATIEAEKSDEDKVESKEDKGDKSKDEKEDKKETDSSESEGFLPKMAIAGYLNLAADFSHNFTDGLAIGASYLAGNTVGIITTATILIHEVPHEIGDFAILIQSGCPRMKAIYLQSTTAIGALIGTIVGLSMGAVGQDAINAILPFTAGGFIYIACASIMPELLNSKFNSISQVIKEALALMLGIALMVVIGWFE
jgi:zinc transporter 7